MKSKRMFLILTLAIAFGLAAGYSTLLFLRDRTTPFTPAQSREAQQVVLAVGDLSLGTVLTEDNVRMVDWPGEAVPVGFARSPEEVVGRSLIADVQTNEVILASKLADSGLRGLIPLIEPGMRALSVKVDEVVGVAGFVTPQTRVDVILIMTPPGGRDPMSKVILQNIQALAAGQQIQKTEQGEPVTVTVVTVLVTPEDAEKLALAANEGRIQMALRNTMDLEAVETNGERSSRLFAGVSRGRPAARTGSTVATARESIIEVYQGGVRTLISY
jgi:pilus assembly protein CpaB